MGSKWRLSMGVTSEKRTFVEVFGDLKDFGNQEN